MSERSLRVRDQLATLNPRTLFERTKRLVLSYPKFQSAVKEEVKKIYSGSEEANYCISSHFGYKYCEMGFCAVAFADMVDPNCSNLDIGVISTEFYIFLDILDDQIDELGLNLAEKMQRIKDAKAIISGDPFVAENPQQEALLIIAKDMRSRVNILNPQEQTYSQFALSCCENFDALFHEAAFSGKEKALEELVYIGEKCAAPIMELINCKFGRTLPVEAIGNLVGIGNILDDYWDVVKDKKAGQARFLTVDLPNYPMSDKEIAVRTFVNYRDHYEALKFGQRLFATAISEFSKSQKEDVFAVALFAQIGVFKRRLDFIRGRILSFAKKVY